MLVILGSARSDGKTAKAVAELLAGVDYELADLLTYKIAPYNYAQTYPKGDEFLSLAQRMTRHDDLILATPVYWYAMSGIMKNFFDRLSDLIETHKPVGRVLKDRRLRVIATGTAAAPPPCFIEPFSLTCDYFEMEFGGVSYVYTGPETEIETEAGYGA